MCTVENICGGDPRILAWEIDFEDNRSLQNWIQQLGLMCEPAWKASILGSVFAMGHVFTLLFIPHLADKLGRKWIYTVSRLVDCLCFLVLLVSRNYTLMAIALGGLGAATAGRLNVGTVYLCEWFPKRKQTFILSVRIMEQASIFTLIVLYFWLIGNSWLTVGTIGLVYCLVSMLATFVVPESPRLLLAQGKVDRFKQAIDKLAWWNRTTVDWTSDEAIDLDEWVRNQSEQKLETKSDGVG